MKTKLENLLDFIEDVDVDGVKEASKMLAYGVFVAMPIALYNRSLQYACDKLNLNYELVPEGKHRDWQRPKLVVDNDK